MGMRMQAWSAAGGNASSAQNTQWQQRQQNFSSLAQAISGGNLAGANAAFAQIQSQMPAGKTMNPNGFLGQVGAALQSGNIASAQQLLSSRFSGIGEQASTASTPQQTAAATTAAATSAAAVASTTVGAASTTATTATTSVGATTTAAATYGRHGHHHRHGGGGSSPAFDLSQAIQSGDTSTAQSSMQTILTDLQQVASMSSMANPTTSGATPNAAISSAVTAANNLLQNPDFQALESAVSNGDASGMQTAWAKLISGVSASASAATAAAPAATTTTAAVA